MINYNSYFSIGCAMVRMPMNFVKRTLGKGEVLGSIPSGGTMSPDNLDASHCLHCRSFWTSASAFSSACSSGTSSSQMLWRQAAMMSWISS